MNLMRIFAVPIILCFATIGVARGQATTLPGGATSLSETHGNWRLQCAGPAAVNPAAVAGSATVSCTVIQEQSDAQSGRRVLAMQLSAAESGLTGTLVLPLGLLLESGTVLVIDEAAPLAPLRFRTCLPAGCVVELRFDQATTAALRDAEEMKLTVTADDGTAASFGVPLDGLGAALDRAAQILGSV